MHIAERKTRELLEQYGAQFVRLSSNSHEVWELPQGRKFICQRSNAHNDPRAWNNSLAQLRRLVEGLEVVSVRTSVAGELACPGCRKLSKLTELGLCDYCTTHGIEAKPKGGVVIEMVTDQPMESPVLGTVELEEVPPPKKKRWSKEEIAELRRLSELGLPVAEIAEKLGRGVPAVYERRRVLKIYAPNRGPYRTEDAMGKRAVWTKAQDDKLKKLYQEGLLDEDIAKKMNKTMSSIQARRKRLGLMKRGPYKGAKSAARVELPRSKPVQTGDCTIRLQYPGGQTLEGTVSRDLADELALRILSGEA